jgi:hypothetical protein
MEFIFLYTQCLLKLCFTYLGHAAPNPNSPILLTSKTTRYVRAPKSSSPSNGAKPESSKSSSSPVWKHSMSASANITPPNVVVGATASQVPAVKEKEKV